MADFCTARGLAVNKHAFGSAGRYLTVHANPRGPLPGIAFLAHMDTVHHKGKFGEPPVKTDGTFIYGPGVCDCKGGIAVALLAMQSLLEAGFDRRPLKLILTSDEEVSGRLGGQAGKDFISDQVRGFAAAINCETGMPGKLTVGRKGVSRVEVRVFGRAAHSGWGYREGASAIREAAHKVIEIEGASDGEDLTFNCGVIRGGEVVNIVPAFCTFTTDIRFIRPESLDRAMRHIERVVSTVHVAGTTAECSEISRRLPMERTAGNERLFSEIRRVGEKYGLEKIEPHFSGGGSDSAYTVLAGVPSVCSAGAIGDGSHTVRERAWLSSLPLRAKLLAATVLELPDDFSQSIPCPSP
ncbi:MAG: M20 family metallopeptidase [Clostridiales bacterium]|nr:M20 family metallopeptidase [Clostridiales bacterium]